ncbi:hypothetical protein GCM10023169_09900 [Georgenia halophila]|uniref:DUF1772 domain-containing protein n=1 Tax=Georgenia halophila TaxID=620889 RepID=A0ABP8KYQ8_9MICO
MIFWSWGRRSLNRQVSPDHVVVLTYGYFTLMFIFSVAYRYRYQLATATPQGWAARSVSDDEALQMLGTRPLVPNLWRRFSIFLIPIGVAVAVLVSTAVS